MKLNTGLIVKTYVLALFITMTSDAFAEKPVFTQTFDFDSMPCDGLEIDGVSYSSDTGDDPFDVCGAGVETPTTNNIDSPGIQSGGNLVLDLEFETSTTVFGFGIAQLDTTTNVQSVVIELYRPGKGMLREVVLLDTMIDPEFSGARYDYTGPAVKFVTIKTAENYSFLRLAIDNITYNYRDKGDKKPKRKVSCPIADIISSYEWPDVPNVEDSATFCGTEVANDDAAFGVNTLGNGLSDLFFESLDDAQWMINANILDQEAQACAILVNCTSYGD